MINQCAFKYTVFKNKHTNEYVALRECSLPFGNKGIEIYYVSDIHFAEKFPFGTKELDSKEYYHSFSRGLLGLELSLLESLNIEVEYNYKKVEE